MKVTIIYDNRAQLPLREGWGFSALVKLPERTVLFDAGADRLVLQHNAEALGLDLSGVTDVFLSHPHCDHIGGLSYVLEQTKRVRIWAPWTMEDYLRPRAKSAKAELFSIKGPRKLGQGLWTTGTMGRGIKEQGLVIGTALGPILITGCAHPGVHHLAARAASLAGAKLRAVLGGFHLAGMDTKRLSALIGALRKLTSAVFPGHCTGKAPTEALLVAFSDSERLRVGFSWELA
jgi:7,8-dihydropterin-6-yl-methyl-4-(beta-D-ribofuranosyl)aminobenzene 5'-phosphate synthase